MSGIKLVHFAKFVNVFGKSDVILIPDNVQINPEYDNLKAMSTEALSNDPPEAGLAWITLVLSSGLLGALFVWSLQNPSVLLPSLSTVESSDQQSNIRSEVSLDEQSDTQPDARNSAQLNEQADASTSAQLNEQVDAPTSAQLNEQADVQSSAQSEIAVDASGVTSQTDAAVVSVDEATQAEVGQPEVEESAGTPLEKLKRQELATLPGLAGRVRYNPQESVPLEGSDKLLNRMFELLFLYIDSDVVVSISSGDFEDDEKNLELSNTRAQNLVAYLVDRGLDEQRFEIVPLGREQLPLGGHRVNVYAKDI